jgi:hypothetical protein
MVLERLKMLESSEASPLVVESVRARGDGSSSFQPSPRR